MASYKNLLHRADILAQKTGQSVSTISRKIMNDGKGLARLRAGGQCTMKTMERALQRLDMMEAELQGGRPEAAITTTATSSSSSTTVPLVNSKAGSQAEGAELSHLDRLEAESIHILREVAAECANPVMLYSIGKDSSVMLHLALKAFYPSKPPFPFLHVDSHWKFKEMIEFRDKLVKKLGINLIVHKNMEGVAEGVGPFSHGSALHTEIMKTRALKQALDKHGFDAAFGGARRDEEKSRAKERIFSFRDARHHWDPKNQRPELWNIYNTRVGPGESVRVFPLSNWTETDIWQYIFRENIEIPALYFAAPRPVVQRNGQWLMVDDDRFPLEPGEDITTKMVRFRTLGCYPLTAAVPSTAATLPEVIQETLLSRTSEREGRIIDKDRGASMEAKKQEGYF